ncbi:MAG: HD domain-containing protein, partial [Candidatus Omnitrophica bacterium]|nr:HD domain-containing protein [Candidatus Omnitrophota bacterium]
IFFTSFFCSIFIGILGFQDVKHQQEQNIGKTLKIIAQTAVLGIYNKLGDIYDSENFKILIKEYLIEVKEENDITEPFYLLKRKSKNKVSIIVTTDRGNISGGEYLINSALEATFDKKKATFSSIYKDKNGMWISAYAPIRDAKGDVLYVLEINREISYYLALVRTKAFQIVLVCFLGCVIGMFLGSLFLRPILESIGFLSAAARKIKKGDYESPIQEVNTRDEIEHLAVTMEHMRRSLKEYISKLKTSIEEEKKAHLESIKTLSEAIAIREPYTKGHIKRVWKYAQLIAQEMNLSEEDIEILEYGCILHDVGKIGVNVDIINKDKKLDDIEYDSIKKHPEMGVKIIEGIPFLEKAKDIILYHQECFDGTGYPEGLKGENIPILARIVSIADTYDAIVSDRSYRKGGTHEAAVEEIKRSAGTQFDPKIVEAFLRVEDKIKKIHDTYDEKQGQE